VSELSDALAVLESMNGPNWDSQFEIYLAALERLPADLMQMAVSSLAGEKWRPAPFEIVRKAAKIEMCRRAGTRDPFPSADEAYYEIIEKIHRYGLYGRLDPERPNIRYPGQPQFSHPLVASTVAIIGTWEEWCDGTVNFAEGLAKQVKSTYERQSISWVEAAAAALCSKDSVGAKFFPDWAPFKIETGWTEPLRRELPARDPVKLIAPPPDVLQKLRSIGLSFG
jgi:hypothetical protein